MSQPGAPERLARELPPGTLRRALARIESLRQSGRPGEVLRIFVDSRGRVLVDRTDCECDRSGLAYGANVEADVRPA